MKGAPFMWAAIAVVSLFHPHLKEKWTWLFEVVRHGTPFMEKFKPIDVFDLFLHTGMTLAFAFFAVKTYLDAANGDLP